MMTVTAIKADVARNGDAAKVNLTGNLLQRRNEGQYWETVEADFAVYEPEIRETAAQSQTRNRRRIL